MELVIMRTFENYLTEKAGTNAVYWQKKVKAIKAPERQKKALELRAARGDKKAELTLRRQAADTRKTVTVQKPKGVRGTLKAFGQAFKQGFQRGRSQGFSRASKYKIDTSAQDQITQDIAGHLEKKKGKGKPAGKWQAASAKTKATQQQTAAAHATRNTPTTANRKAAQQAQAAVARRRVEAQRAKRAREEFFKKTRRPVRESTDSVLRRLLGRIVTVELRKADMKIRGKLEYSEEDAAMGRWGQPWLVHDRRSGMVISFPAFKATVKEGARIVVS